ncbi:DNA polymerase IV [Bifidobacterium sp. ESL0763]|uniref:DNA polymerase IV n=1 Tax=Bifidobacterium sp. ESL0763 TaxID=2983227 RepID=UPI0023F7BE99|nr:DNA polymerase IV [Bifidobacterium sp. ESL0763]MDF7663430.1 DNA polymerase IV [Bifidobacterium sp. ESL0763]
MSTAPRNAAAKRDWGHDESGCTVLHIDMDAFYASLETARHPELRGRPVIIGWLGPRSVVSAANYEARKYGVNSAMPMVRAQQLCPGGAYVQVDMAYYRKMSKRIFDEVFRQVTDRIEQVSVDEGYMDVSGALLRWKSPSVIGAWIRAQVAARFGITCSVGIAANKLVAKMASTNAKPDGMLLIPKARHAEFVRMMPLRGIPGVGPSLEKRLGEWGIRTVAELAEMDETTLAQATRSKITAHNLYLAARGQDERPIVTHAPEKSIGAEITFEKDTRNAAKVRELLHHCSNEVTHTLRAKGLVARTVNVKLRFADMSYSTKAHTLERPTDTAATMYPEAVALLKAMLRMPADAPDDAPLPREIRLAGVSASSLSAKETTPVQLTIEDMLGDGVADGGDGDGAKRRNGREDETTNPSASNQNDETSKGKNANLRNAESVLDAVRERYGSGAASLGLEHGDWKARQTANNHNPEA